MAAQHVEPIPGAEIARPDESRATTPGWLVSGGLHLLVLLWLATAGVPSCSGRPSNVGPPSDGLRDVGIVVKPSPTLKLQPQDGPPESAAEAAPQASLEPLAPVPTTADEQGMQALIELPEADPREVIGFGPQTTPVGGAPVPEPATIVRPNGIAPPSGGGGLGEVEFMGQSATAQKIVYVIDTSSSMNNFRAVDFAKFKLQESVNQLDGSQQFQVIDYADTPHLMKLRGDKTPRLYRADDSNRVLATRHIGTIAASGGTKHMPALRAAFGFEPDVIFFLTDAEELQPSEIDEVTRLLNRGGRTTIHCIKFGQGPDLVPEEVNFLRTLARRNHGTYTYRNVEQLGTR